MMLIVLIRHTIMGIFHSVVHAILYTIAVKENSYTNALILHKRLYVYLSKILC